MPKKTPQADPPMSVRVRKIYPFEGSEPSFAVFMTDLDGNVTVRKGKESDCETFRSAFDQRRNDIRRAAKSEQIRYHQKTITEPLTSSVEQISIQKEAACAIKEGFKRVIVSFKRNDHARAVLAHVLTGGSDWEDSKNIAKKLGLTIPQVTTSKRKIQRRIKKKVPALQEHLGSASEC